jgi:hypothetical protein
MRTELGYIYSNLLCPRQDGKSPNEPVLQKLRRATADAMVWNASVWLG